MAKRLVHKAGIKPDQIVSEQVWETMQKTGHAKAWRFVEDVDDTYPMNKPIEVKNLKLITQIETKERKQNGRNRNNTIDK